MSSLTYFWKIGIGIFILLFCSSFAYRVIPVVTLNGQTSGSIFSHEFSKYDGLHIDTTNHSCAVSHYTLYHISLTKDIAIYKGTCATFSPPIQASVQQAEKGDKYIFINVKVHCQGERIPIHVNPLNFNIK
ncbi:MULTISPECIES: hypothetical protein [unclassified Aureispira]|uniref:hypothetical protein n=1 Tax=unclassified Aureispira TaxID=2649989 RepID=UPI000696637E|nr:MULTISPECIES: hypothetical protein [unclassified Aureispira]WMX12206.1 hypothetical protein QP953_15370 [Aureispira sp. CCB-E]